MTAREPIAVIGMACRFPQAASLDRYWAKLCAATPCFGPPPATRSLGLWDGQIHGAFLDQIADFDWRTFGMLPREVRHMDPQHRLLLELAWEALDDAGLPVGIVRGSATSVHIGMQWSDYLQLLAPHRQLLDGYAALGTSRSLAANRISHHFGLCGPSMVVDAGCASALAALHQGCRALWMGDAETALVGAVELILSPESTALSAGIGMLSASGRSLPLDARADGGVRSEGGGLVVLKPWSKLTPADRVYALVCGVGAGHNGPNDWIVAAHAGGQARAVRAAMSEADIPAEAVEYIELHAVGSLKGDPVELSALADALGPRARPRRLGTIKAMLGHMGAASGMAALIKVALTLHHRMIPPAHPPGQLNPELSRHFDGFTLLSESQPWPDDESACAALSAIGLGGSNVHAILRAAPSIPRPIDLDATSAAGFVLPLSARSPAALAAMAGRLADHLRAVRPDANGLADICFTLKERRAHESVRLVAVGHSAEELAHALDLRRLPETVVRDDDADFPADGLGAGHNSGRVVSLPAYPWQRSRVWPEALDASTEAVRASPAAFDAMAHHPFMRLLRQARPAERAILLGTILRDQIGRILRLEADIEVGPDDLLTAHGLESLSAAEWRLLIARELDCAVSIAGIFVPGTIAGLRAHIERLIGVQALEAQLTRPTADDESELEVLTL